MAYSYPYTHPSLNYVYPQAAPHPGFAVGAMNPVTTGVAATTNQSAQSVGISVNINRPDSPVSASHQARSVLKHIVLCVYLHTYMHTSV